MSEHGSFTSEESYMDDDTQTGRSVIRIASVAALGGFLFGYDSAVINGAVEPVQRSSSTSPPGPWASPWPRRCSAPLRAR